MTKIITQGSLPRTIVNHGGGPPPSTAELTAWNSLFNEQPKRERHMMKELLKVTLDARQIREACEIAVRDRVSQEYAGEKFTADGIADDAVVTVEVTKKRVRKAKSTTGGV